MENSISSINLQRERMFNGYKTCTMYHDAVLANNWM